MHCAAQALLNNLEAELAGPPAQGLHARAVQTRAEPAEAAPPADAAAADDAPAQPDATAGQAGDAAGGVAGEGDAPGEPAREPAGDGGGSGEGEASGTGRVARVMSDSVSMASETGEARGSGADAGSGGAGAAGTSGQARLPTHCRTCSLEAAHGRETTAPQPPALTACGQCRGSHGCRSVSKPCFRVRP